jgi:hypothetical protein
MFNKYSNVYWLTDQKGDEIMAGWPTGCRVRTTIDLSEMAHDVSAVKFCTTLSSLWWTNSSCRARKHVADARTAADIHKTRDLFCLLYLINSSTENECRVRKLVCGRRPHLLAPKLMRVYLLHFVHLRHQQTLPQKLHFYLSKWKVFKKNTLYKTIHDKIYIK